MHNASPQFYGWSSITVSYTHLDVYKRQVEDSVLRVCKSRGFKHVNVFTTPTCVIISDEKFDGLTFMKTISKRTINLTKIDRLNDISRQFVQNEDIDPLKAISMLQEVDAVKDYDQFVYFAGTAMASASFAYLIGGTGILDFILTLVIASIGAVSYTHLDVYKRQTYAFRPRLRS